VKEIEFTSAAVRRLRKLIATTRAQIDTKLKAFAESGIGDVKALRVPRGCGCARVTGASCSRGGATPSQIHAVGHRGDIYD
jgi:mRNA interferase RelE/StbE